MCLLDLGHGFDGVLREVVLREHFCGTSGGRATEVTVLGEVRLRDHDTGVLRLVGSLDRPGYLGESRYGKLKVVFRD